MMLDNLRYKKLVEKHPHLKGVTMDHNGVRPHLPVHIILGNSECPRISTTEPQHVGREWDPVASYTKLGWTITSPGKEIDTTSMLLTQTSRADYEELCKLDVLGLADMPSGDQGVVCDEFKEQLCWSEEGWYETKPEIIPACQTTRKEAYAESLVPYGNTRRMGPSMITML